MNEAAIAPAETPAAAPWRVYQVTEYDCWIGQSKEDVIRSYCEIQGCSVEDCEKFGLIKCDEVRELSDAELDRRMFVDDTCSKDDPTRKRTFRAELERLVRVEKPEFPLMFSSTEF